MRPQQCAQPMKHLEPKPPDLNYLESETSDIERGTGDHVT